MPKTYNNLWDEITSFENIYNAYSKAIKCKRYRNYVLKFNYHLEINLLAIQKELREENWEPHKFRQFYVYDPKKRLISAPNFSDRIVHHALANITEPLFERKFICDSYACRIGKGVHKAAIKMQKFQHIAAMNFQHVYVIKGDIHHYFENVDQDILMSIVKRTIRDRNTLNLCEKIIYNSREFDKKGMPVGSLTSQIFANIYLNQLDHFVKDILSTKFYIRYMDDFIILDDDKAKLWRLLNKIEGFLNNTLKLELNPKTAIFPMNRGVDFVGYRIWPTHILPRKRTIKRTKKRFKKFSKLYADNKMDMKNIKASLMSFLGYIKHCNAHKTTISTLEKIILKRD